MLKWLDLLLNDPAAAESRILKALLKESPEYPDWSLAVQPVLNRLLQCNRIKRSIVSRVLGIPTFNAFALPHRTIVVSQLLVDFCRGQTDQMAFVLGHEVAHLQLGHARQRDWANTLTKLVPLANPLIGFGVSMLFDRAFTREQEFEADAWAIRGCARAGYSPSASMKLLERLGNGSAPSNLVTEMLSTHPPLTERVVSLNQVISGFKR